MNRIFARVAGENPASIALHRKHGFEVIGVEREVGRKFGTWLDVTVMQRLTPAPEIRRTSSGS